MRFCEMLLGILFCHGSADGKMLRRSKINSSEVCSQFASGLMWSAASHTTVMSWQKQQLTQWPSFHHLLCPVCAKRSLPNGFLGVRSLYRCVRKYFWFPVSPFPSPIIHYFLLWPIISQQTAGQILALFRGPAALAVLSPVPTIIFTTSLSAFYK